MDSSAGTEFPVGLIRGFRCVPGPGRRHLGRSSKLTIAIRVHEEDTRKGDRGRGHQPGGCPCGQSFSDMSLLQCWSTRHRVIPPRAALAPGSLDVLREI